MVQWSSKAKVAARQKVARTNSMIGEWAVATGDPPKESGAKQLYTSSTMWNFVGGSKAPRAALWRTQSGTITAVVNALAKAGGSIFPRPKGNLVSQKKRALTEANYCWPAVSVCSCLIAAFR